MLSNENLLKSAFKFYCNICDYGTCKKSSFNEHLSTMKHKKSIIINENLPFVNENLLKICSQYICENCNKKYKDNSGLWRHKNKGKCKNDKIINNDNIKVDKMYGKFNDKDELIVLLVKQNAELIKEQNDIKNIIIGQQNIMMEQQNMMIKVIENGTNNTNITHTNSHNKAFNLNFFLNETCKDAMNITDFVDSIKLQLSDLEKVGEVGYVEGISNIIIKNLNDLDETKRPVHCTDKKRETIYIKDQGQWEKEDDNKTKLKKSINKIANKNIKLISQFREKYPECKKSESKISDKYNKMIIEAMGGPGDNTKEKEEKIIRNITKATIINK
jgi:hypothetical protein